MEGIIKTYGRFLLEAGVFVLLFALIFFGMWDKWGNVGAFHMIGAYLKEEQEVSGKDFLVCVSESKRGAPQIVYKNEGMLQIGTYDMTELFYAEDCEGNKLPLQLEGVCDPQGVWTKKIYPEAGEQICFAKAGIYTLRISTTDAWNHRSVCKARVPVNP